MSFPTHRPRRLRRNEALRGLVRETKLSVSGMVYPMFACPGTKVRTEVSSMPGIFQQSVDQIVEECREVAGLGIPAVFFLACRKRKTRLASEAADRARSGAARDGSDSQGQTESAGDHRRVPLRIHRSMAIAACIENEQVLNDPTPDLAGRRGAFACASRRGHRGAFGHDGWARSRDSPTAGRK